MGSLKTHHLGLIFISSLSAIAISCARGGSYYSAGSQRSNQELQKVSLSDLQTQALKILETSCTKCHSAKGGPGNVSNLLDVDHLLAADLIVAGKPEASALLKSIEDNRMPPSGSLDGAKKEILNQWVLRLGKTDTVSNETPPAEEPKNEKTADKPEATDKDSAAKDASGEKAEAKPADDKATETATVTEKPKAEAPTYKMISKILEANCVACHNAEDANAGFRFDSYENTKKAVSPKAQDSLMFNAVNSGAMPFEEKLTDEQIQMIHDWIEAGAKNN
jgi:mono/diheme cytochrome c family protein